MKMTSETPRLPHDALGVQPAGGTPSIQPSVARARVGVACVSLNAHDVQFESMFKQSKRWVEKDRQR